MKNFLKTKSFMTIAAASVAAVVSVGFLSSKVSDNVIAQVDYDRIVQFDYVTQEDIEDKKAERDAALEEANKAGEELAALQGQVDDLSDELKELQGLSDAQAKQYEEISIMYSAALTEKAEALDAYIKAEENLNHAREVFSNRISVMFEYQNKSTFEVLLESDSLAGFFTNLEIISLIADSDSQAVDMMTIALDEAQLANDNALLEAEELEGIAQQRKDQLDELRSRIGVTEEALDDISVQITTLEKKEDELNGWASTLDSQIKELQEELYRKPTATPVVEVDIPKPVEPEVTETLPSEPTETEVVATEETTESTGESTTESTTEATEETTEETEETSEVTEETTEETTEATEETTEETEETTETSETEIPEESQIEVDPTNTPTPTPTPEPVATATPAVEPYVRPATNGSLSWPTWSTNVTSYYGNRVHPVYGVVKFHTGIDIGAGMGDSVMAAASGTVIYLETPCLGSNTGGSGYGNYLIIDHGNGVSTLYGHCRDICVNNGDYVNAGQQIGEVGSTGTSTAAHLHFEVREYGSTVDPLSYLP